MLRRNDNQVSERLERALSGGPIPHDEETRSLLAVAGALAGPTVRSSAARTKQTQDAMLLAFRRSMNPQTSRDDAGSSDGLEETELHRQEAELPGGGRLVVSDIEEISPARLEEARSQFAAILERRSKDSHR